MVHRQCPRIVHQEDSQKVCYKHTDTPVYCRHSPTSIIQTLEPSKGYGSKYKMGHEFNVHMHSRMQPFTIFVLATANSAEIAWHLMHNFRARRVSLLTWT